MLQQDPDAQVVANCMSVLLAVSKLVGGCCSCLQHLVHLVCCQLAATHHWLQHLELYLESSQSSAPSRVHPGDMAPNLCSACCRRDQGSHCFQGAWSSPFSTVSRQVAGW